MKNLLAAFGFFGALLISPIGSAAPFIESGDAGHTLETTQPLPGGVTTISGRLGQNDPADVYKFGWTGGTFSASTSSNFDPMLFVFDSAGNLLAFNDDSFSLQSFVSLFLASGEYLLGIDNYSLNYGGNLSGFGAGTNGSGQYTISLSTTASLNTVPEPTTVALLGLGLLGFAASRRKSMKKNDAQ